MTGVRHPAGTCAQVSAGNQLFHMVVDTDDIATRITALLAAERAGRVTFVPLNRMRPQPVTYPDCGSDAFALMRKLHFDEVYRDAVQQVGPLNEGCRFRRPRTA